MATTDKNYYEVLGVKKSASADDIKKSFRKLAQKHHPDAGGDEAKFKEISAAYETLGDTSKRAEYDNALKYGAFTQAAQGGRGAASSGRQPLHDYGDMGGWGSIFERMAQGEGAFGTNWDFPSRKAKGHDVRVTLEISFEEAFSGTEKRLTIKTEEGGSQKLDVKVPAGATEGGKLRYAGKGGKGVKGGPQGDLIIITTIKPHKLYARKGADVLMNLPVSYAEAALGAQIVIPAPEGSRVKLRIPAGTQEGTVLMVKGKGAPHVNGHGSGDLKVSIHLAVPKKLNTAQKAALEAYAELEDASKLRPLYKERG
jgi:curved DNA-binding protein